MRERNSVEKFIFLCIADSACQFSNVVAVIAFLASIGELEPVKVLFWINFFLGFLVGEFFFEQMSSVKSRKHFVLADLSFSSNIQVNSRSLWLVSTEIVCRFLDCGLPDLLLYDDLPVEYQWQSHIWLRSGISQDRHLLLFSLGVRLGQSSVQPPVIFRTINQDWLSQYPICDCHTVKSNNLI